jgi:hypothetical protein
VEGSATAVAVVLLPPRVVRAVVGVLHRSPLPARSTPTALLVLANALLLLLVMLLAPPGAGCCSSCCCAGGARKLPARRISKLPMLLLLVVSLMPSTAPYAAAAAADRLTPAVAVAVPDADVVDAPAAPWPGRSEAYSGAEEAASQLLLRTQPRSPASVATVLLVMDAAAAAVAVAAAAAAAASATCCCSLAIMISMQRSTCSACVDGFDGVCACPGVLPSARPCSAAQEERLATTPCDHALRPRLAATPCKFV